MSAADSEKLVLVIGAAGLDMVGRLAQEPEAGTSTPARIRMAYGGVARNVAENLARLGQPCALISAVGDDIQGLAIRKSLEEAGVDAAGVRILPGESTGAYLAIVDANGRLRLALDEMRPLESLTPDFLREKSELFHSAGMLFLDMNLAPESIAAAIAMARRSGMPVSADPTSRHLASRLTPHLRGMSLVIPNAGEAEVLLGNPISREDTACAVLAAQELVARGVEIAVITLAEFGVAYASRKEHGHFPALRTAIVDPTGAGDALTAVVLFGLMNGIPLAEAIRLGISAASLTLRSKQTVVPDLSLEKLYEEMM